VKNFLSALLIAGAGFVLVNFTFLFFYAVSLALKMIIIPGSTPMQRPLFMPLSFAISTVIFGLVSWFVFRFRLMNSHQSDLYDRAGGGWFGSYRHRTLRLAHSPVSG
jgi:hypothetical protein